MPSKKMIAALNKQINAELYSSYLYLAMAADFYAQNLTGMAQWMTVQAKEEDVHAMKIFRFVIETGHRAELDAIGAPPKSWKNPAAAFAAALKHEQKVTGMINNLMKLARDEKDYATETLLQWFVTEQIEEEANTGGIAAKLKLIGDSPNGLFMYDAVLGRRVAE